MASGSCLLILPRGNDHAEPLFHPFTRRTCGGVAEKGISFSAADADSPLKGERALPCPTTR